MIIYVLVDATSYPVAAFKSKVSAELEAARRKLHIVPVTLKD